MYPLEGPSINSPTDCISHLSFQQCILQKNDLGTTPTLVVGTMDGILLLYSVISFVTPSLMKWSQCQKGHTINNCHLLNSDGGYGK